MMTYYIHRLRCWLALMRTTWAQAGAEGSYADWQMRRDVAKRRKAHQQELARQLVKMRDRRMG